jgi:hypothetical protein
MVGEDFPAPSEGFVLTHFIVLWRNLDDPSPRSPDRQGEAASAGGSPERRGGVPTRMGHRGAAAQLERGTRRMIGSSRSVAFW